MLVVVGGHSRNIGKTSVITGLIRRLRRWNWTAIKITQFGHGVCSEQGESCQCSTGLDHPYALDEEFEPSRTDSGRFLGAGALRSFWLRTASGQLENARPVLDRILAASQNTIIESNSILEFFQPDLYLVVLDFAREDFKASTLRFLDRADAFLVIDRGINAPLWDAVSQELYQGKRRFALRPPQYMNAELWAFVEETLSRGF